MVIVFPCIILGVELVYSERRRKLDSSIIQAMEGRIQALETMLTRSRHLDRIREEGVQMRVNMEISKAMAKINAREKVAKIA